ncbi:MAG: ABC transporter permease [Prevotella sp.]
MVLPYLINKEFKQMLRNRLLPIVFVILPIALVNTIPRLATQEVKGIRFATVDNDHSTTTRRLIDRLDASDYLEFAGNAVCFEDAMKAIDGDKADAVVEFPRGYEKALVTGRGDAVVQVDANAVNGTKGAMAGMYISQIIRDGDGEYGMPAGDDALSVRYLYNENLEYKYYMTPVIFAMILILIVGFLPALNIVSEKEKGTIEQINVTPIGKLEFILSKLIPYIVVGLLMTLEGVIAAKLFHGIMPAGSIPAVFVFAALFCMLVASLGVIVSNYSSTLQQAALTMFFFLVIFILLSGLLTPIRSMPEWAQNLTLLNPMRYIISAFRDIYLKGGGASLLMPQFIPLAIYTVIAWAWAIVSYRKNE